MARLLLVDDDMDQLEARRLLLETAGHEVSPAANASEAISLLPEVGPELVVMDLRLPQPEDGIALIRGLRQRAPQIRIIVLSGWPADLSQRPEAAMVDHLLPKPVKSKRLLDLVGKIAVCLFLFLPLLFAEQTKNTFPLTMDTAAEVVAELDFSAPGADWGRAGRESVLAVLTLDDTRKQHVMVFAGAERYRYSVLLGSMEPGAHQLRIERHPDYSARGIPLEIHNVAFRNVKAGDADYPLIAQAPIIHARPNTVGKFSDIPLLAYVERLPDNSLRYSVIFSNEDGGTSTRGLMARWGRVTDIEHVYQIWLDPSGKPLRAQMQTRNHKDVPFQGRQEGSHPLLGVVTDNNMVDSVSTGTIRFQPAPILVDLNGSSRERVMDDHPVTHLISSRELEREGKLRRHGTIEGTKISAPENYIYVDMRIVNKESRLAVLVRLEGENFWRSSHLGFHDLAIERSGWVRTGIELPPATQPAQVVEIAFQCLPEFKTDGAGQCRIEAVNKLFFLDARQRPSESFWRPRIDRGPWIVPAGQMRGVAVR
jgi:CheY-like chemotaxis protein